MTGSDLVERLRDQKFWYTPHGKDRPMRHVVAEDAADEIERLRAALERITKTGSNTDPWPPEIAMRKIAREALK